MTDERLNGVEGEENNNANTTENQANENPVAPESLEAFIEEQVNGGEVAEDVEPEEAQLQEQEEPSETEPTATYNWTAQDGASSYAQPQAQPPEWADNDARGTCINMQVKKKKKRKLIIGIVICAVAFYILLTAALIFGISRAIIDLDIDYNLGTGRFEINGGSGNHHQQNQPQVEEYLEIQPTPKDDEEMPAAGEKLTVKQIAKKVRTSVVGVIAEGSMNFSNSSVGSGIIMSQDGYIITNNHVIENMNKISVVMDDGKTYQAHVIGTDSRTDLAVLKVEATGLPAAEFGDSDLLEQGDLAVAIGNPAGIQLQNTVTTGVISAINRNIVVEDAEMTLIQTDASINPGNSGGPLVNEYGQVIGINTVKIGISYYEGLGFAIPINTAKPIIDELISRGYITGRPSIGISGTALSERDAVFYGLKAGMYVEFVHPYSDAYKKGLQAGDVIVAMNGTPLTSTEEIKKIRDQYKAGDSVKITVYRQGREFEINVILMDEAELNKMGTPSGSTR